MPNDEPMTWNDVLGLIALIILGLTVYGGWPASGAAIGFAVLALLLGFCEAVLAEEVELSRFERTTKAVLGSGKKAAKWVAIGCTLVWLVQLVVNLLAEPDAASIGEIELNVAEALGQLRRLVSPLAVFTLFAAALGVAVWLNSLWPMGAASRLRSWTGNCAAILGAVASFGFVAADSAARHYERGIGPLRARIVTDLQTLVETRQEGAAYHWLSDIVHDELEKPDADSHAWAGYILDPVVRCRNDQTTFIQAWRAEIGHSIAANPTYCEPYKLEESLATRRIVVPAVSSLEGDSRAWLPEFSGRISMGELGTSPTSDGRAILLRKLSLREVRGFALRAGSSLRDAEKARDALRGTATGAVSDLLKRALPQDVHDLVGEWSKPLIDELARKGSAELTRRLRFTRLAENGAVAALLGVPDDGVRLVSLTSPKQARTEANRVYSEHIVANGHPEGLGTVEAIRALARAKAAKARVEIGSGAGGPEAPSGSKLPPKPPKPPPPRRGGR